MKAKVKKKTIRKYVFVWTMLAYPIILFLVFWLGVNLNSFALAFQNIRWTEVGNVATFDAGFDNFRLFFQQFFSGSSIVYHGILNSVRLWFFETIITLPLSILFSYFIFKKCVGYRAYRMIIMMPQIVSAFVFSLIFRKMVDGGLITQLWAKLSNSGAPSLLLDSDYNFGVILFYCVWLGFSTKVIVYANAMKEVPEEILESARVDGVNNMLSELWYMVLPLIWPTISTFLITGVAGMLTASGPLMEFYGVGNVPNNVYTLGFYYTEQLVNNQDGNMTIFPFLAAGGLILSFASIIVTYLMRWGCNKLEAKFNG